MINHKAAKNAKRKCKKVRMISSRNLMALPHPIELRNLTISLAILDAILSYESDAWYYRFDPHWKPHQAHAQMFDGMGGDFSIIFTPQGVVIKGFDNKSAMTSYKAVAEGSKYPQAWPGIYDNMPLHFRKLLDDLQPNDVSYCLWWDITSPEWKRGKIDFVDCKDPDGSEKQLAVFDGHPLTFQNFARVYYEQVVPLELISFIYRHRPISDETITALNPKVDVSQMQMLIHSLEYGKLNFFLSRRALTKKQNSAHTVLLERKRIR
jgi:hypothetical protein